MTLYWAGARAVTGDWVPRTGMECERARGEAQLRLQDAIQNNTFEDFMQELRERGHVGLANEGLRIWRAGREPTPGADLNDMRDRMCVWRGWLDWEVRMVRPQLHANVSTWNMGPLGYEASKEQLRRTLGEGRAVLMVQELCFPLGAHRRVKRELNAPIPTTSVYWKQEKRVLRTTAGTPQLAGGGVRGTHEDTLQWPPSFTQGSLSRCNALSGTQRVAPESSVT